MRRKLADLVRLLNKQTEQYTELHVVLSDEHEIIAGASPDDLFANNKKKEVVILQIKLLEESCSKLLTSIFTALPGAPEGHTLTDLLGLLPDPYRRTIDETYGRLLSVAQSVRELNAHNEQRIRGSLRAVQTSISYLVACAQSPGGPIYEKSGQFRTQQILQPLLSEEA